MAGLAEQLDIFYMSDHHQRRTGEIIAQLFGDFPGKRYIDATSTRASLLKFVTQSNINAPDFAMINGDIVDFAAGGEGESRQDNFVDFVERVDGGVGAALVAPLLTSMGHWDVGSIDPTQADYDQFFSNTLGLGSIIPGGDFAPQNAWWPAAAATGNQACSYTVVVKGWRIIVLTAIHLATVGMPTMGADASGAKTQQVWFQAMLDEAETAKQPVLVFSHQMILSNATATTGGQYIDGFEDVLNDGAGGGLENQTIPSVVVGAHVHALEEFLEQNDVFGFNGIGNCWALSSEDGDRFTYYHLKIVPESVWDGSKMVHNIEIIGYGHGTSRQIKYAIIGA